MSGALTSEAQRTLGSMPAGRFPSPSPYTFTTIQDDYDPAYAKDGEPSPYITLEKAQEIALTQANVNAANAVFDDREFDHDDGTPIFELEFTANGNEYEYDIHAVTGKVVRAEHKTIGTQSGNQNTDVHISVPFTNKWDIECDLTHDQSLIEQYNSNNKVNFTLLPSESYTDPDKISLPKGVNETTASYLMVFRLSGLFNPRESSAS